MLGESAAEKDQKVSSFAEDFFSFGQVGLCVVFAFADYGDLFLRATVARLCSSTERLRLQQHRPQRRRRPHKPRHLVPLLPALHRLRPTQHQPSPRHLARMPKIRLNELLQIIDFRAESSKHTIETFFLKWALRIRNMWETASNTITETQSTT